MNFVEAERHSGRQFCFWLHRDRNADFSICTETWWHSAGHPIRRFLKEQSFHSVLRKSDADVPRSTGRLCLPRLCRDADCVRQGAALQENSEGRL